MSCFILIGQCGIQLGFKVVEDLHFELKKQYDVDKPAFREFFHFDQAVSDSKPVANIILVDMEPKVIESFSILTKKSDFMWNPNMAVIQQEGSGNNWAYGFYIHGRTIKTEFLNTFNKLRSKIDNLTKVILIQSIAGGTGSGVGSFLLKTLSDEFSELFFVNFLVVPKLSGEVILQYYNSILSLTSIYEHSHAIYLLENDKADLICKSVLKMQTINLDSMNFVLSKFIVSALLVQNSDEGNYFDVHSDLLLPLPSFKLLGSRFLPLVTDNLRLFTTDSWKGLISRAQQMVLSGSTEGNIGWNLKSKTEEPNSMEVTKMKSLQKQEYNLPKVNKSLGVYMECYSVKNDFEAEPQNELFKNRDHFFYDLECISFLNRNSGIIRKIKSISVTEKYMRPFELPRI